LVHQNQSTEREAEKKITLRNNKGLRKIMMMIHTQNMTNAKKPSTTTNIKVKLL
jgi:hypothetical protein